MKILELSVVIKTLQWFLGIGFVALGAIILSAGDIQLGLCYLVLGMITVPLLKLPVGFRTAAIVIGALLL